MILRKANIERLQIDELYDLAKFVVTENFKHHTSRINPLDYEKEINYVFKEELKYFGNAQVFVSRGGNISITGSIRVLRWNFLDTLPVQKMFNINPVVFSGGNHHKPVWHIGRFAIKKGNRDINLFKQLMVCAIAPISNDENAVAYAECDNKLLRVLMAWGINARRIGNPVYYLGSETTPVCMAHDDLIDFYNKNKSLVARNFLIQNVF